MTDRRLRQRAKIVSNVATGAGEATGRMAWMLACAYLPRPTTINSSPLSHVSAWVTRVRAATGVRVFGGNSAGDVRAEHDLLQHDASPHNLLLLAGILRLHYSAAVQQRAALTWQTLLLSLQWGQPAAMIHSMLR